MKKFVKSFLMAAAALMLFASCNGLIDATVSGEPDKAVITIGIDGITDSANRSARNIDPTSLEGTAPTGFGKITLKGYSEKGYFYKGDSAETEETLTWDGTKAKIKLEYDVWYLTMTAYDSSDNKLLEGRRRVDLKNGAPTSSKPLTFTLSTEGVSTPGYVTIRGKVENPNDLATKYTAALYDVYTNELVNFEDGTTSKISGNLASINVQVGNVTKKYGKFAYNYDDPDNDDDAVKSIKPGRYNFRIYFYMTRGSGDTAKDVSIGTWNEIVVVSPGRTSEATDLVLDGILNKAPDAPTALSAYYVGVPGNKTNGDDFNVLINWTPSSSKNEEYYKLVIKDWTDGTEKAYKEFDADHEFFASDIWVAGTLAGGTNSCTVKLPVGKKYEITLAAVNAIGESDAVARTTTGVTPSTGNTAYGSEKINLMKIAYDLNGGTLKTAADKVQVGGFVNKYYIFKDETISVMEIKPIPETGDPEYPQLTKQNHPFLEWDDAAGAKVESITTFGNKNLTANYNVLSIIDYTIDDTYGSIDTEVKQSSDDVKNTVLKNESNVTITVKNDSTAPAVTHIQVRILGLSPETDIVIDKDSSSEIVIDTQIVKSLDFRTYTVQVIATKADGKLYSNTFAITKQR